MSSARKSRISGDTRRRIAACLAIAFLFFATSVGLWHRHTSNSPDSEATCQICHIAHHLVLVLPQVEAAPPQLIQYGRKIAVTPPAISLDPITLHESPRAPPTV